MSKYKLNGLQYEIIDRNIDNRIGTINYEIQFTYDSKKYMGKVDLGLWSPDFSILLDNSDPVEMVLDMTYGNELKHNVFAKITDAETGNFLNSLVQDYIEIFQLERHKLKEVIILNP